MTMQVDGEVRNSLPFDLDMLTQHPSIKRWSRKYLQKQRGIYRIVSGSCQLDAFNNGVAVITEQPGGGRIWFLRRAAIFDAQQPQAVSQAGLNQLPALGASPATVFNNNPIGVFQTIGGGTVSAIAVNGTTTGLTSGTVFIPAGGTLTVTYTVLPTTYFTGQPVGTVIPPQTSLVAGFAQVNTCSIYAEPTPPSWIPQAALGFSPNPPSGAGIIEPSTGNLPFAKDYSNWGVKIYNQENLYAVVRGITGTSGQIAFVCRVSEYNIEDVELMNTGG